MRLDTLIMTRQKLVIALYIFSFCCLFSAAQNLYAETIPSDILKHIGADDAIIVSDPDGKIFMEKNADKKLIPASTLKLLTSLAALHHLGPSYRFSTEFYTDKDSNLKIKGYGDPLLTSEFIIDIAKGLGTELKYINDVIVDDSYFEKPTVIPGVTRSIEPYDSPNGALCVNFNTVSFSVSKGKFISAEQQTPLLPFAIKKITKTSAKRGRILLTSDQDEIALYAGHLISYFIEKKGIKRRGEIRKGAVNLKTDRLIIKYDSPVLLDEIVSKLLYHSNNFIANQILITLGARIYGPPGTLEKGVSALNDYAKDILKVNDLSISEGSGISRENLIPARSFLKILAAFEPYRSLMKHNGSEYFKTGTLTGVSTRAGYIKDRNGRLYKFVIMTNSNGNSAATISKKLCSLIE
ncbi:MAG: D-alanyl-D-alanine carboxypeptidase [Desulfobacteraceae bacterium]|nr:MAG: D-alanyl-D-alanine carboxypeptidase [Desulfobacteraceae bacterium]